MHERNLYAAHPINTYGTPLEAAYLSFLRETFQQADIIDPNSAEVKTAVKRINTHIVMKAGSILKYFTTRSVHKR